MAKNTPKTKSTKTSTSKGTQEPKEAKPRTRRAKKMEDEDEGDDSSTTIIPISEDLRIRVTMSGPEFAIQKRRIAGDVNPVTGKANKEPGKESWVGISFHGRIEHSLARCLDFLIAGSKEHMTVLQLHQQITQWQLTITNSVKDLFKK